MSAKPKKRIAPTLVGDVVPTVSNAFEAAAHKKNPLENAADMIAMRYGIPEEAPKIDEAVFKQNRAIGKKVVPLKEYFEQTAKDFVQKEAEKKEEAARKKREYAKLTPCQRKLNTLQRNLDGYIQTCDRTFSNERLITMADNAREKAARASVKKPRTKKAAKAKTPRGSMTPRGGRRHRRQTRKVFVK